MNACPMCLGTDCQSECARGNCRWEYEQEMQAKYEAEEQARYNAEMEAQWEAEQAAQQNGEAQ